MIMGVMAGDACGVNADGGVDGEKKKIQNRDRENVGSSRMWVAREKERERIRK